VNYGVYGFAVKLDSGNLKRWGNVGESSLTAWKVLGGPIIGFQFKGKGNDMSIIVGDRCKPKYFGARKLSLRLGEKREVRFDWQESDADHYSKCLSYGLFHVQNSGKLGWVDVTGNKAAFFPAIQDVYPSTSYLSLHFKGETLLLELSVFRLYSRPTILQVKETEKINGDGADYRGF
jgi:hypothetical protein